MPTALTEALAHGSPEVTVFVTRSCNKAVETVSNQYIMYYIHKELAHRNI